MDTSTSSSLPAPNDDKRDPVLRAPRALLPNSNRCIVRRDDRKMKESAGSVEALTSPADSTGRLSGRSFYDPPTLALSSEGLSSAPKLSSRDFVPASKRNTNEDILRLEATLPPPGLAGATNNESSVRPVSMSPVLNCEATSASQRFSTPSYGDVQIARRTSPRSRSAVVPVPDDGLRFHRPWSPSPDASRVNAVTNATAFPGGRRASAHPITGRSTTNSHGTPAFEGGRRTSVFSSSREGAYNVHWVSQGSSQLQDAPCGSMNVASRHRTNANVELLSTPAHRSVHRGSAQVHPTTLHDTSVRRNPSPLLSPAYQNTRDRRSSPHCASASHQATSARDNPRRVSPYGAVAQPQTHSARVNGVTDPQRARGAVHTAATATARSQTNDTHVRVVRENGTERALSTGGRGVLARWCNAADVRDAPYYPYLPCGSAATDAGKAELVKFNKNLDKIMDGAFGRSACPACRDYTAVNMINGGHGRDRFLPACGHVLCALCVDDALGGAPLPSLLRSRHSSAITLRGCSIACPICGTKNDRYYEIYN